MTTQRYILLTTIHNRLDHGLELFPVVLHGLSHSLTQLNCYTLLPTTHHLDKGFTSSNSIFVVLSAGMGVTDIVHFLEVVEGSLDKCSLTLTYVSAPSKQNTRKAVPTVLLSTVDQPLALLHVLMP